MGKEFHAVISFKDFCPIKHPEWYEEDEDSFKSTRQKWKRDKREGKVKKHASIHIENLFLKEEQTAASDTPLESFYEANDPITHER